MTLSTGVNPGANRRCLRGAMRKVLVNKTERIYARSAAADCLPLAVAIPNNRNRRGPGGPRAARGDCDSDAAPRRDEVRSPTRATNVPGGPYSPAVCRHNRIKLFRRPVRHASQLVALARNQSQSVRARSSPALPRPRRRYPHWSPTRGGPPRRPSSDSPHSDH